MSKECAEFEESCEAEEDRKGATGNKVAAALKHCNSYKLRRRYNLVIRR